MLMQRVKTRCSATRSPEDPTRSEVPIGTLSPEEVDAEVAGYAADVLPTETRL